MSAPGQEASRVSGGPEQRGNDAEQLSWESDRELKMELRKTATGAAESDGRTAGGPITAGAPVPSTELSRGGSGGDERAERCGRRSRGKGNLKVLRTLPKQLTRNPKQHGEGGNMRPEWSKMPKAGRAPGATAGAQNRFGGKARTG